MMGNCQVRFLGGRDAVTYALLPDKKHTRSVEYKTSGWSLSTDKRCLTFKDGFAAGKFKLIGNRDLHFYAPDEMRANQSRASCRRLRSPILHQRGAKRGAYSHW
jgi:hypothetical protein